MTRKEVHMVARGIRRPEPDLRRLAKVLLSIADVKQPVTDTTTRADADEEQAS